MFEITKQSFSLSEAFLNSYKGKQPNFGPLGLVVFLRTYARQIEGENRVEEFWEVCKRVVEGTFSIQKNHCKIHKLPWNEAKAQKTAKKMFEFMWEFRFLPPGRGLWAMGTAILQKTGAAALTNCGFCSTENIDKDPISPFTWLMDFSMLGTGIGYDLKGAGKFKPLLPLGKLAYQIPDTREGWVESLRLLLMAYSISENPLPVFDYSLVRAAGVPIKGFGGISGGPGPLKDMHSDIQTILNARAVEGVFLSSVDIVDIMNLIGRCIVSGNSRRSSEIALGDATDTQFLEMKQDAEKLLHHRWASNNSVFAKVGMDYTDCVKNTVINGEPGYVWMENAKAYGRMIDKPDWADVSACGVNPCSEQILFDKELCTLVETFPSKHNTLADYLETLKIAYLYAKTVTLISTHCEETNSVMLRNRRIGLSQSGIIKAFKKHGRREMLRWCDEGYKFIRSLDNIYSNWLGIPKSIKVTTTKPSGSVSLLPGEPPGIHYPHSEYYIRRIRLSKFIPLVDIIKNAGYKVEAELGKEDSSVVAEFPIHEEFFEHGKSDVSIWEQAANAVAYQKYWSDNSVSITVTFAEHEKDDVKKVLEMYEDSLKSISFLPLENHGYAQAPYETITKERYETMVQNLQPLRLTGVSLQNEAPKYCDSENCTL